MDKKQHWEDRYQSHSSQKLSWYQARPDLSLEWIAASTKEKQSVIDIGAGASTLVDYLLKDGYTDISLFDLSQSALDETTKRLGPQAEDQHLHWLLGDITDWQPQKQYALWHDRAVFHFLTESSERQGYKRALLSGLAPGGALILGTFALGGPEKCSGLPIVQYSAESLSAELGGEFVLQESRLEEHQTPSGGAQSFNWCRFRRR